MKSVDLNFVAQTEKQLWGLEHSKANSEGYGIKPKCVEQMYGDFSLCVCLRPIRLLCSALRPSLLQSTRAESVRCSLYPTRWHKESGHLLPVELSAHRAFLSCPRIAVGRSLFTKLFLWNLRSRRRPWLTCTDNEYANLAGLHTAFCLLTKRHCIVLLEPNNSHLMPMNIHWVHRN